MQINSYNSKIIINSDISSSLSEVFSKYQATKICIITDDNTYKHCLPKLTQIIQQKNTFVLTIGQGEKNKNIETLQTIWNFLQTNKFERDALVINLGGGLLLDIGGFAAATYNRGIKFIHIPTTLLSMVDASVGGKLGFNFNGIKNQIGLFRVPEFVLINPDFLKTLDKRQLFAGWAEMIKHSLIDSESHFNKILKQNPLEIKDSEWVEFIYSSIKVKNYYVTKDPNESDLRKVLNLGHTVGHAFESLSTEKNDPLLHGEAVANGLICELFLSAQLSNFPQKKSQEIIQAIIKSYKRLIINQNDITRLVKIMHFDKKNKYNKINFTLLNKIGTPLIDQFVGEDIIEKSLEYYKNLK
jgi:3-dehydroquinate synthase